MTFLSDSVVDGGRVWTIRIRRTPLKTIIIFCSVEYSISVLQYSLEVTENRRFQVPSATPWRRLPRLETLRRTVPKIEQIQYRFCVSHLSRND